MTTTQQRSRRDRALAVITAVLAVAATAFAVISAIFVFAR